MRLVHQKTYTGHGHLLNENEQPVASVSYRIEIHQRMMDAAHGQEIPGLQDIEGSVSAAEPQILRSLVGLALVLLMEDGQKLGIFISDSNGKIANRSGFIKTP